MSSATQRRIRNERTGSIPGRAPTMETMMKEDIDRILEMLESVPNLNRSSAAIANQVRAFKDTDPKWAFLKAKSAAYMHYLCTELVET